MNNAEYKLNLPLLIGKYLDPLLAEIQNEKGVDFKIENYNQNYDELFLKNLGSRFISSIYSKSWRVIEAASLAYLEFIDWYTTLYIIPEIIFKITIEVAQVCFIYENRNIFINGLKILSKLLFNENDNIDKDFLNDTLISLGKQLILKSTSLNQSDKEMALNTIISFYLLKESDKEKFLRSLLIEDSPNYSSKTNTLPDKITLTKLELLDIFLKRYYSYENHKNFNWYYYFNSFLAPLLSHERIEIRYVCIEILLQLYKLFGVSVINVLNNYKRIHPKVLATILEKIS